LWHDGPEDFLGGPAVGTLEKIGVGFSGQERQDTLRKGNEKIKLDGKERVILPGPASYGNPSITHDGSRVVFSDVPAGKVYVVGWDAKNKRFLVNGFGLCTWFDSDTGIEWVYAGAAEFNYPVNRYQLDNPQVKESVWNKVVSCSNGFQVSADGTRTGSEFPHPNAGVATLPNGSWQHYGNGCEGCIAPDNSYRFFHMGESAGHSGVMMYDGGGINKRMVPFIDYPGMGYRVGEVPFTVKMSAPSDGDWEWGYGDETKETAPAGRHTYRKAGRYTITARQGDTAGDGLDGKIIGDVEQVTEGDRTCIRVKGRGSHVKAEPDRRLNFSKSCTLEAWVRPKTTQGLSGSAGIIMDKSRGGAPGGFRLDIHNGISAKGMYGSEVAWPRASYKYPADSWTHIAAVYDANSMRKVYIAGKLRAELKRGVLVVIK